MKPLGMMVFAVLLMAAWNTHAQSMSAENKHACEVAMCLANPDGPTALAECRPPIQKMQRDMARGKAFPKCPFTQNNNNEGGGNSGGGGGRNRDEPPKQLL